jgi:hypothetical protein
MAPAGHHPFFISLPHPISFSQQQQPFEAPNPAAAHQSSQLSASGRTTITPIGRGGVCRPAGAIHMWEWNSQKSEVTCIKLCYHKFGKKVCIILSKNPKMAHDHFLLRTSNK